MEKKEIAPSLFGKLLKVQTEVEAVTKDSINPHFKSNYADINAYLAAVKPVLSKNGVLLLQPIYHNEVRELVLRTILVDAETGEKIEYETVVPSNPGDPQKTGSGVTYFRRYTLQALLSLQAEDDDGNAASVKSKASAGEKVAYLDTVSGDPLNDDSIMI